MSYTIDIPITFWPVHPGEPEEAPKPTPKRKLSIGERRAHTLMDAFISGRVNDLDPLSHILSLKLPGLSKREALYRAITYAGWSVVQDWSIMVRGTRPFLLSIFNRSDVYGLKTIDSTRF